MFAEAAAAAAPSAGQSADSSPQLTIADIIGKSEDFDKIREEIGTRTWMEALFTSEVTQSFSAVLSAIKNNSGAEGGNVKVPASADQVKTVRALEASGTIVNGAIVLGATPASPNSGLHDLLELLADDKVIEKYSKTTAAGEADKAAVSESGGAPAAGEDATAVDPTSLLDTVLFALVKPKSVAQV